MSSAKSAKPVSSKINSHDRLNARKLIEDWFKREEKAFEYSDADVAVKMEEISKKTGIQKVLAKIEKLEHDAQKLKAESYSKLTGKPVDECGCAITRGYDFDRELRKQAVSVLAVPSEKRSSLQRERLATLAKIEKAETRSELAEVLSIIN